MTALPEEIQIVMIALAASLALGLPVRIVGWRATLAGIRIGLGWANRHRFTVLILALIGAMAGLWSLDQVRDLVFTLTGRMGSQA